MKKKIDRYHLVELLANTPSGDLYKAEETLPGELQRPLLLKILPSLDPGNPVAQERFYNEARLLIDLGGHPCLVGIYGIGVEENVPWIAMEYAADSAALHIGEQPAPPAAVARMIEDVCRGLGALHGLTPPRLHNAVRPVNILIDKYGNHKLMEFSSAGPVNVEPTIALEMVRYSAPELLSREFGQVAPATDLYALGHIAYEMSLGKRNFRQQFSTVFSAGTRGEADPHLWQAWHHSLSTLPPTVHEIRKDFPSLLGTTIARLMHKNLAERYVSTSDVLADLRQAVPSAKPAPAPSAVPQPAPIPSPSAPAPPAPPVPGRLPSRIPTPAAPTGPVELYYVRFRGRVSGPYDFGALKRMVKQGQVSRLHQVSTDRASWCGIDKIDDLQ